MPNQLQRSRTSAMVRQGNRCHYCGFPMWVGDVRQFATDTGIKIGYALQLECTAEHLTPRSEGGSSTKTNIVAACRFCNAKRHARKKRYSPDAFRCFVQRRLARGGWHNFRLD